MKRKFRVAVIGCGQIGRIHIDNLLKHFPDVEIAAVVDAFPERVAEWADSRGITTVYNDSEAVIADESIDAVFVCSITNTHAPLTLKALAAGKHVFCEKPVSFDESETRAVIEAVEKSGLKCQIGFNRRFDHNFNAVRKAIDSGNLGKPQIINIISRDPEAPPAEYCKTSGGIFYDMTIHDFDMARFLAGSDVTEVYATAACTVAPEIGAVGDYDTALVSLKFANGAIGSIDNCMVATYGYDQRVNVLCANGAAEIGNDKQSTLVLSNNEGVTAEKPLYFFLERYNQSYIDEVRAFFESIINNTEPLATPRDALQAELIARAATESARTGRPVKV